MKSNRRIGERPRQLESIEAFNLRNIITHREGQLLLNTRSLR